MLTLTEGKIWKHHSIRSPRIAGGEVHDFKTTYQQDKEWHFGFQKVCSTCQTKSLVLNSYSGTFLNQKKKNLSISIGIDLRTCCLVTWTIHSFELISHSFLPEEEIRGSLFPINNVVSSFCLPHVRLAGTSQSQIPKVYWEQVCCMLFIK